MDWLYLVALAFGLAMDAFAVAVASGMALPAVGPRHVFRLAFHFGLFQFMMPVLGWFAGRALAGWIAAFDHWIALGLLSLIGGKMIVESFHSEHQRSRRGDPTRGWSLVTLSVATSIDALAVGLSLAILGVAIWGASAVIGVVAAGMTALGLLLGSRVGARLGVWAERVGGAVLIAIGVRILVEHLSA